MSNNNENNLKKIGIKLLYIIIIPIVLYDILFIMYTISHPYESPSFFGFKTYSIVSGSMEPIINIGDLIIVKKDENSEYDLDDIVSFQRDEDIVTHRIFQIEQTTDTVYYYTKGDNNEVGDIEKLEAHQIEGKFLFKIPFMGNVALFLKNKIIFGIVLIILIFAYIQNKKNISRKVERKEKRLKFDRKMKNSENEDD